MLENTMARSGSSTTQDARCCEKIETVVWKDGGTEIDKRDIEKRTQRTPPDTHRVEFPEAHRPDTLKRFYNSLSRRGISAKEELEKHTRTTRLL